MAKRMKYNNGGISIQKDFKNVGDLETSVSANISGDQKYQRGTLSASATKKGITVRGETSKDSFGNKRSSISASKKVNDKLTIGVERRPQDKYTGVFFEKKF